MQILQTGAGGWRWRRSSGASCVQATTATLVSRHHQRAWTYAHQPRERARGRSQIEGLTTTCVRKKKKSGMCEQHPDRIERRREEGERRPC